MKRQSDDASLVVADQGRDPTGNKEDVFRQAGALDLLGCRAASIAFRRLCNCNIWPAESTSEHRSAEREAALLSGSAGGSAGHDKSGSDRYFGKAPNQFPLD